MRHWVKTLMLLTSLSLGISVASPVLGQGRGNQKCASQSVRINSDTSLLIAADFDKFLPKTKGQKRVMHQARANKTAKSKQAS